MHSSQMKTFPVGSATIFRISESGFPQKEQKILFVSINSPLGFRFQDTPPGRNLVHFRGGFL